MAYDIGDLIRLSASFTNSSSALTDPTTLQLSVRGPGASVLHVYGTSASLIKSSSGIYYLDYPAASAGEHYYLWSASGAVETSEEGAFDVLRHGLILAAYAETADVAAYCSNLISGATDFSSTTTPRLADVVRWLNRGAALIDNRLKARGFTPPTDSTVEIFQELVDLNAYYAVARAEMARTNVRLSPGERTRGQVFQKYFDDGLKDLLTRDLSRAGLSYTHLGYVGGVSESDKATVAGDGDRVPARFSRDQFKNPRTIRKTETGQTTDIEVRQ